MRPINLHDNIIAYNIVYKFIPYYFSWLPLIFSIVDVRKHLEAL